MGDPFEALGDPNRRDILLLLSSGDIDVEHRGYRGRFGMYLPPLLEALGLADLTHDPRNDRMRPTP
jgi:hypothetical protein